MHIAETSTLSADQKEAVLRLWNNEYPANLSYSLPDFDTYLQNLTAPQHYLLLNSNSVQGWAFTFVRNDERWFALIIDSSIQRTGYGSKLLDHIKAKEQALNGWVIDNHNYPKSNGDTYLSPLPFYLKNGFRLIPDIRLETEKLSAVKIYWTRN